MKQYIIFGSILIALISGCSSKQFYEPKELGSAWDKYEEAPQKIVDASANIALLQDRTVLSKTEHLKVEIPESHRVVAHSDDWIISASIDGKLKLTSKSDKTIEENFDLKKTVATANIQDDLLAVLFADNEMALYDVPSKATLFKEQGGSVSALDSRMTPPLFMQTLVLFATLDGKIVIVNSELKKRLRTIIVSSEDSFNNIIYANVLNNKIIAATPYKIISMSQKDIRAQYEIRNVVFGKSRIYITTKQGELIALTPNLQVDAKTKFSFAHFLGMIDRDGKLYILEKEGYLIVVDKKSFEYTVHEVSLDDGFVFVGEKEFYVNDEKIVLE